MTVPTLAQVTWDGSVSTDFSDGANWSGNNAPGPADAALINSAAVPNYPVVTSDTTIEVLSISDGFLTVSNAELAVATQIVLSGAGVLAGTGTHQFVTSSFTQTGGNVNNGTILNAGAINAQAGNFAGFLIGTGDFTKTTVGTYTFIGSSSQIGNVFVNAGTLNLQGGLGSDRNWTVASGALVDLRTAGDFGIGSLSGAGTIENNGIGAKTIVIGANNASGSFSGVLKDGTSNLAVGKQGTGTQILSGANTYSGNTTISGGTLQVSNAQALGNTTGYTSVTEQGTLVLDNVAIGNEQLYLGGTLVGNGASSLAGDVTIFAGPTVRVDGGNSLLLSGNINSGGAAPQSLTKTGAGLLTLGGTVTHSGGTTIAAGTLQIGNGGSSGTLSGNVVNAGTLAFNRNDLSTFAGNINGTGSVTKAGAGTLVLTGNAAHTGGTTITAGTLQVGNGTTIGTLSGNVANAGTLIFSRSDATSYGGVISGAGTVVKSGTGTLTMSGANTYTGPTSVTAGTLAVTGSIGASAVTVNGGTLSGTGTLGATTIVAGMLSPGNSIGVLTVNGALNLGAAATLTVEVRSGGNALGVHSDLVKVNGPVTINPAAKVVVRPENGTDTGQTYSADTKYTIVQSTGLTGTFASAAEDFAFLDATLSYDPTNAYLTLKRNDVSFAAVAGTSNQAGAANALSAFAPGDPVTAALLGLSPDQAKRAYELASGDSHAAGQAVLDQTFSLFQGAMGGSGGGSGAVMSYLDAGEGLTGPVETADAVTTPLAPNAIWLTPMAGQGVVDNDGNGAATSWIAGGLAAGYERRSTLAGGDLVAGLGIGYSIAGTNTPARLATSQSQGGQVGVYGGWTDEATSVSGSFNVGANHVSSQRDIVIGGLSRTATAQYWMQGAGAAVQAGYAFEVGNGFKAGPVGGVELGWSGHNGFTETGAGNLNATVGATSTWRVETAVGLQFGYELAGESGDFELTGRALWLHNFGDVATQSTVSLAGGGAPFTVVSPTAGRDRLELGAAASWSVTDDLALSLDYTGRFFGGQTDHMAKAGLTIGF